VTLEAVPVYFRWFFWLILMITPFRTLSVSRSEELPCKTIQLYMLLWCAINQTFMGIKKYPSSITAVAVESSGYVQLHLHHIFESRCTQEFQQSQYLSATTDNFLLT
jgi:hypothetical protein